LGNNRFRHSWWFCLVVRFVVRESWEEAMSLKLPEKTKAEACDREIAHYELVLDNPSTTITRFKFRPGQQTGWHRHEHNYLTVQLSEGKLKAINADGSEVFVNYKPGTTRYLKAVIEHNAINVGDCDLEVLEIEFKK